MKSKLYKTHLNNMNISSERLSEFIKLFERKTGQKLTEKEALAPAETLLRTISILYKPINKIDYYTADIAYPFFEKKPNDPQN